jgi:hypothetical protein
MTKPGLANAQLVDAQVVDEFAETQVLVAKPATRPAVDDEATAQSVYSEYVQELERMLKAETAK